MELHVLDRSHYESQSLFDFDLTAVDIHVKNQNHRTSTRNPLIMETRQIRLLLGQADQMTKRLFKGIFTPDQFVNKSPSGKEKAIYVIFSGNTGGGLGHWLGIFYGNDGTKYFIDSLGGEPSDYSDELADFLGQNCWSFPYRLQTKFSTYCGLYVCMAAFNFSRNVNPPALLSLFHKRSEVKNDMFLKMWWSKRYGRLVSLHRHPNKIDNQKAISYENYMRAVSLNKFA